MECLLGTCAASCERPAHSLVFKRARYCINPMHKVPSLVMPQTAGQGRRRQDEFKQVGKTGCDGGGTRDLYHRPYIGDQFSLCVCVSVCVCQRTVHALTSGLCVCVRARVSFNSAFLLPRTARISKSQVINKLLERMLR